MSTAAHSVTRAPVRGAPRSARPAYAVAALAAAAALPLFVGAGRSAMQDMVLAAAYVIMALGLNVVVGFAGLLHLGYVAFFAIGAHVAAYLGSAFWGIHVNFLIVLVLAVATTTVAGVLIGVPTLRLRGDYVGVVTLAFGEIVGQVVSNGRDIHIFGGTLTGGPQGIPGIDRIDLPFVARFGAPDLRPWYWFALALVAMVLVVNFNLRDSRLGRAWVAMRDDEAAAACSGIWGVVLGAIILSAIDSFLLPSVLFDLPSRIGLDFDLSAISSGIYGFLLVIMMLLRPQGLIPARRAR